MYPLPEWWVKDWGNKPYAIADCLDVMKRIPGKSIDLILADPPYSSGGMFRGDRNNKPSDKYQMTNTQKTYPDFTGDNRDARSFLMWCNLWMGECFRILKPGRFFITFTDWRQLPIMTDAIQIGGFIWRGIIPWNKTEAARPESGKFRNQCEYLVWGSVGQIPISEGSPCLPGFFSFYQKPQDKTHLTGKPISVIIELIKIVPMGSIVLDPFLGSGTTLAACRATGRIGLGFEINPDYEKIIEKRYMAETPNIEEFEKGVDGHA